MKLLFIGLGVMGGPMATHLSKQHEVSVYNRNAEKSALWKQANNGSVLASLDADLSAFDFVLTCLGDDDSLRDVFLENHRVFDRLKDDAIVIDHTTSSAKIAIELGQQARDRNFYFIDAPVSGGEQGAINGQLTVMCGGNEAAYEKAAPIMDCYAKKTKLMGAVGSGQLTKMANQIAIAGLVQGLSECIHFTEQAGLDSRAVIEVISKGAAQSWQMDNRHETMIEGEYEHGFAVDWMRKDLGIVLEHAAKVDAELPVTQLVDQYYEEVQSMGGNRWDTSSLLERLRKR